MSTRTSAEQIVALENARAAKMARMSAVMGKSIEDGRSSDEAEQEEFDTLEAEVKAIDEDLARYRTLERMSIAEAAPVTKAASFPTATTNKALTLAEGTQLRNTGVIRVSSPKSDPGIRMARVVKSIGASRGNLVAAVQYAENVYSDDGGIVNILKGAVAAGTTGSASWSGALVGDESAVFADFVDYLRPQTILGKFGAGGIPSLRRVPFRVPLIGQTGGGVGYWVGEGAAKPLTSFDFERKTLEPLKVANIAVLTMECLRDSSPSAETLVRDQLAAALRERLDTDFIVTTKAASAGVSPASVTYGVAAITSSGNDAASVRVDVNSLFGAFIALNNAPTNGVWIMSSTTALALSLMVNPLGQPEFPGINMNGGTFFGLPVITSQYIGSTGSPATTYVVLMNASDVYLADDGGIAVDMSMEASLEMSDAPSSSVSTGSPIAPVAAQMVSLWQTNSVGFRAERTINWMARRTGAVQVLTGVAWGSAE
jgi:Phage capsid family